MPFIYALRNRTTDLVYYGSTTMTLPKRLARHRTSTGKASTTGSSIAQCPTAYIELLEEVSEEQMDERERWWIENHPCVNRNIPNRTSKERLRAYYLANREKRIAYACAYQKEHLAEIMERRRQAKN